MEIGSYLDPAAVKKQCEDIIVQYRSENTDIAIVRKKLQAFINERALKSDSYKALKSQISDYMLLLSGIVQANNYDIVDCNTLKEAVGDEVLNGEVLIPGRDRAKALHDHYRSEASRYSAKASCCADPSSRDHYLSMERHYRRLASQEWGRYLYFVGKINKYDAIEAETSGLFSSSSPLYGSLSTGLADVSNNFSNKAYHVSRNNDNWKNELKKHGAKVKVYPPHEDPYEDIKIYAATSGSKTLYELASPMALVRHGVRLSEKKGKYYFHVGGNNKREVQNYLKEITGKEWKGKSLERSWQGDGLSVTSKRGKSHLDSDVLVETCGNKELAECIGDLQSGLTRGAIAKKSFTKTFTESLNPKAQFKEFKNASKLGKVAKGLGFIGDALTVASEFEENFCADGEIIVTPDRVQNFVTDTAVDFVSSAGTAAAGAAVGSLILPPVGTAVGFLVGVGLDLVVNADFADFDGDGNKDSLVDGVKQLVDMGCNAIGDCIFG